MNIWPKGSKSSLSFSFNFESKASLLALLLWMMLGCLNSTHAASLGTLDSGIAAFRAGNYGAARPILNEALARPTDAPIAQAYLWAMEDKPGTIPAGMLDIIATQGDHNTDFKVLEGQLHLLGLHPTANKEQGIRMIKTRTVEDDPYALYTLARYYEGIFGGVKQMELARQYYKMAKTHGYGIAEERRKALKAGEKAPDPVGDGGSTWKNGMDTARGDGALEMGSVYSGKSGGSAKKPKDNGGHGTDRHVGDRPKTPPAPVRLPSISEGTDSIGGSSVNSVPVVTPSPVAEWGVSPAKLPVVEPVSGIGASAVVVRPNPMAVVSESSYVRLPESAGRKKTVQDADRSCCVIA